MKLQFDVTPQEFGIIEEILANNLTNNCQVWVFGSRAKNSALFNSDLDLALECNHKIASKVLTQLKTDFEKSKLPYRVDVLNIGTVEPYFQEIINKKKILFPFKAKNKVPQLRFSEFSNDWNKKKYNHFYSFKTTNSYSRDKLNYEYGEAKNIHYGDIHTKFNSLFDIEKEYVPFINEDVDISRIPEDCYLKEGDLVIADASEDYNDIGKTIEIQNLNGEKVVAGLHTFLARIKSDEMANGFASFLLKTHKVRLEVMKIAQGTKVLGISKYRLEKIPLFVPTPPEQSKIATFLTAVDTKIEQLSKRQALLSAYKKGVMQKIFSQTIRFKADDGSEFPDWKENKLGDVGIFYRGHSYNSINVKDDGLLVLRSSNIKNGLLVLDKDLQFVDKDCSDNISLRKNDIVICMANGSKNLVGKSGVYHGDYNNKLTVGAFCSIFRTDSLLSKYILQTVQYKKYLHILLAGTNINNLKNSELAELKFNLPYSIEEQTKIANFLSSIDTKIKQAGKQLYKSKEFKKALLQQMFV